jgi:hypothetical protein
MSHYERFTLRKSMMPNHPTDNDSASPLPTEIERVSAYAWQCGAVETILFRGAAQLTTAAGPLDLENGTWLLARWAGMPLEGTPDGELVCILPGTA